VASISRTFDGCALMLSLRRASAARSRAASRRAPLNFRPRLGNDVLGLPLGGVE
jgi:hypothetical protein